jgi:methionine biosynthesis protein MetW
MSARTDQRQRADLTAIGRWVREGSRVLDLGCGDGHLLSQLQRHKRVEGYGIDIDIDSVTHCVAAGINVIQSDLERGLSGFGDQAFDYVILNEDFDRAYADLAHIFHAERMRRSRNLWLGPFVEELIDEPLE